MMRKSKGWNYVNRRAMQRDLFPGLLRRREYRIVYHTPQQEDMALLADFVLEAGFTSGFTFLLVGSVLEDAQVAEDLDVVIMPKRGTRVSVTDIEEVLLALRHFGTWRLQVLVDPCFRKLSEAEVLEHMRRGTAFVSWKLESPQLGWQIEQGKQRGMFRRAGRFLVAVRRAVHETDYFEKLPASVADGRVTRVLRPALLLDQFGAREKYG